MNIIQKITIPAALLATTACGASISPQLEQARQTMNEAEQSLAARLEPDEVREAERLLAQAERASDGSEDERHYAYLADRQARLAMANARAAHVRNQTQEAHAEYVDELEDATIARNRALEVQGDALADVRSELGDVRSELEERGDTLDARTEELQAREQELAQREAELVAERERRAEAERRAADAMSRLSELAQVREEQNETIITLSGEVLFEYDQAELRPNARQRLEAVAAALRAQPDRSIRVEGHTDSRGSDGYNEDLSRRRAEAVRRFLVEQGVEEGRVSAVGRGEAEPVAPNGSPEGRANNRRVEIVLGASEQRVSQR